MESREYKEYLQSKEWAIRRQACLERFGGQCALCENKAWHVHHRTYDRVGHEHINDLTALCGECHAKFHGKGKYEEVEVVLMVEVQQSQRRQRQGPPPKFREFVKAFGAKLVDNASRPS